MADAVQFYMEDMIPELEDLEKKKLFTKTEIRSIVKRRTNFEYALKRRISKKIDFLRYIEYEMNLESLRKKRKTRVGDQKNEKKGPSDYAGVRHINHLFKRATNRFGTDITLWKQYIQFMQSNSASNQLSRVFVQAIQMNPNEAQLWVMAACWEFEHNANTGAARVLMQRGLRLNPEAQLLWHEYFKLELLYVEKIKTRRRLLGIDEKSENTQSTKMDEDATEPEDENTIQLPTITGEDMELWEDTSDGQKAVKKLDKNTAEALKESTNPILQGSLAKIIFENAIKALPEQLEFRTAFVDIYRHFSDTTEGCDRVFESIRQDMNTKPAARAYLAERHLYTVKDSRQQRISPSDLEFVSAIESCVNEYKGAMRDIDQPDMSKLYIDFLTSTVQIVSEENMKRYLSTLMEKAQKKYAKKWPSQA